MQLTENVLNAVNRYFSSLSNFGYKSYKEVYKLLIYIFIEEILNGSMCKFVTEEDYKLLNNYLECLYGSCMISYPEYKEGISKPIDKRQFKYRYSQDDNLRLIDNLIRID